MFKGIILKKGGHEMENTKEFIGDLLIDSGENLLDAFSNNELVKQIPCIKGLKRCQFLH